MSTRVKVCGDPLERRLVFVPHIEIEIPIFNDQRKQPGIEGHSVVFMVENEKTSVFFALGINPNNFLIIDILSFSYTGKCGIIIEIT